MNDIDIIKAMECCYVAERCDGCPKRWNGDCLNELGKDALDLINRLKAEIERLQKYYFTHNYHECHNEAVKEFAEKLKERACIRYMGAITEKAYQINENDFNNLVKEMTEGENGNV